MNSSATWQQNLDLTMWRHERGVTSGARQGPSSSLPERCVRHTPFVDRKIRLELRRAMAAGQRVIIAYRGCHALLITTGQAEVHAEHSRYVQHSALSVHREGGREGG
jgi:hypothetical protein